MSDPAAPDDLTPDERDDLQAAEYVLGTLPLEARREAETRAELDPVFAARITDWQQRLAPFNENYTPEPAPDLLPRIEDRLFGAPVPSPVARAQRAWTRPAWWVGAVMGTMTAAALLIAVLVITPPPGPTLLQANLTADAGDLQFTARWDPAAGQLELTRAIGDSPDEDLDYELWLIGESGVPQSLGLLRDPVTQVTAALAPGQTLAISLEPAGGSPENLPTGPVLAAAELVPL